MLNVTPQAINELHVMLTRALAAQPTSNPPEIGLRLIVGPTQIGERSEFTLALDTARESDEVVEHDGDPVLFLDPPTSQHLQNLTLDVVDTPGGKRLGIRE